MKDERKPSVKAIKKKGKKNQQKTASCLEGLDVRRQLKAVREIKVVARENCGEHKLKRI